MLGRLLVSIQNKFDLISREDTEKVLLLEEFIRFMKERVDLEHYYSRMLEKIDNSINVHILKGGFALKSDKGPYPMPSLL